MASHVDTSNPHFIEGHFQQIGERLGAHVRPGVGHPQIQVPVGVGRHNRVWFER